MKRPIVRFTFSKNNNQNIDIDYHVFDNLHSKLWLKSLLSSIDSKFKSDLYGFSSSAILEKIKNLNLIITKLNSLTEDYQIKKIKIDTLEADINFIHRYFVDNDKNNLSFSKDSQNLWSEFNTELHGLEILSRNKKNSKKQIFVELENQLYFDLPLESEKYFTIRKIQGYCYANYPHVGRHLLELYLANDKDIDVEHFVPMTKINGSSHLWFGKTTPLLFSCYEKNKIKKWYNNNLKQKTNKSWKEVSKSLGWLPVAKTVSKINSKDLTELKKLIKISYVS